MANDKGIVWIALAVGIFDDEKIKIIDKMPDSDAIIVIWIKILVLAGRLNRGGILMMENGLPYDEEMLAAVFERPLNTVRLALGIFEKYGMICYIQGAITLPTWDKYQHVEELERVRGQTRKRVEAYRERQEAYITAALHECSNVTSLDGNACVTPNNNNNNNNHNIMGIDYQEEFEALWVRYPRKLGKKDAMAAYIRARRSGTTPEDIAQGIDAYNEYIETRGIDMQYIKHGSTYFRQRSWEDEYDMTSGQGDRTKTFADLLAEEIKKEEQDE